MKAWWTSKTLWANAVAVVAAVLTGFGIDVLNTETQGALVVGIVAVTNMVLRSITKQGLSAG